MPIWVLSDCKKVGWIPFFHRWTLTRGLRKLVETQGLQLATWGMILPPLGQTWVCQDRETPQKGGPPLHFFCFTTQKRAPSKQTPRFACLQVDADGSEVCANGQACQYCHLPHRQRAAHLDKRPGTLGQGTPLDPRPSFGSLGPRFLAWDLGHARQVSSNV